MRTNVGRLVAVLALAGMAACGDDDDPTGPAGCDGTPIAIGQTVTGTLAQGDELDIDGAFLDGYRLTLSQSTSVVITMRSTEVDAFLWLVASDFIEVDDDSGEGENGTDAQIAQTLAAGCYRIEATSRFVGETGTYTLSVTTN